jgi:acetyl esterase/lipase
MLRKLALILAAAAVLVSPAAALAKTHHASKPKHHAKTAKTPAPNSGKSGSRCLAEPYPGPDPGPDASLDTTSLGPTAPAPYEIGRPDSGPVQRVMMLIHGGGWYMVGTGAMRFERSAAASWESAGWETVNIDYPPCRGSLLGVLTSYDLIRQQVGGDVPICVEGQSSGAQLALLVAALRPDVACVIAAGAPTNLRSLASEGAKDEANGSGPSGLRAGSAWAQGLARSAFGRSALGRRSPITWASQIQARVLLATAANDPYIPYQQETQMAAAIQAAHPDAYVDVDRLEAGPISWFHGTVSQAGLDDFAQRTTTLVQPFGNKPSASPTTYVPPWLELFLHPFGR